MALAVALGITTFLFTTIGVAGSSMEPTLNGGTGRLSALVSGDRLYLPKYETWLRRLGLLPGYERGDIVIAREPADSPLKGARRDFVVKRVVAVPGDTVAITRGRLQVNGVLLAEEYIAAAGVSLGRGSMSSLKLAEGEYFLLGDNRTNSADSRLYGPIEEGSIAARAAAVIFPPVRDGELNIRTLSRPPAFDSVPDRPSAVGDR